MALPSLDIASTSSNAAESGPVNVSSTFLAPTINFGPAPGFGQATVTAPKTLLYIALAVVAVVLGFLFLAFGRKKHE